MFCTQRVIDDSKDYGNDGDDALHFEPLHLVENVNIFEFLQGFCVAHGKSLDNLQSDVEHLSHHST